MINKEWLRMAKFALVGGLNTGVDFAVFVALVYGIGLDSALAQVFSYFCGFLNSYWLNRRWTFRSEKKGGAGELARFGIVNALSFLFATGVLLAAEKGLGCSPVLAKLISVGASLAVNYAGSRLWVFRKSALRQET